MASVSLLFSRQLAPFRFSSATSRNVSVGTVSFLSAHRNYSSAASFSDPYSLEIPTVRLSYEKHPSKTSSEISKLEASKQPVPEALKAKAKSKEPILFLHGLFGSKTNTRSVSRALARDIDRDVYCIDLRNHGDSQHHPVHTYPALAADVEQFMISHKIGPSIIIGHSMGAKAAMAVALRPLSKQLCAALVSVDNAPWSTALSSMFPKYVKALQKIERSKITKNADAYKTLNEVEPNVGVQQFLMSNVKRALHLPDSAKKELAAKIINSDPASSSNNNNTKELDHETIEKLFHSEEMKNLLYSRVPLDVIGKSLDYMGDFPYLPSETRFNGPTLFVRGKNSPYVPDESIPLIGEFFPRFTIRDIDSGHWVISEKPHEFMEDLKDFISKNVDIDE